MPLMFDKRDNLRAGHCAVRIEPIFAHSRSDATVEGPTYRYVSLMPLGNIIKHIRSCCPRNFSNRLNDVDSTIQQSDGLRAAYSPPQIENVLVDAFDNAIGHCPSDLLVHPMPNRDIIEKIRSISEC